MIHRKTTGRILFPMAEIENMHFQKSKRTPRAIDLCLSTRARSRFSATAGTLGVGSEGSLRKRLPKRDFCHGFQFRSPGLEAVEREMALHRRGVRPMRRHYWPLLLLAAALRLSAAATNICESNLAAPDGTPLAGGLRDGVGILITPSAPFSAADGSRVDQVPARVRVVNGAFCVALEPNDTAVPSGSWYVARWQLAGGAPRTECWYVPTSGTALGLNAVVVSCASPGPPCTTATWSGLEVRTWSQLDEGTWGGLLCQ